jgi:hypothetical protein
MMGGQTLLHSLMLYTLTLAHFPTLRSNTYT